MAVVTMVRVPVVEVVRVITMSDGDMAASFTVDVVVVLVGLMSTGHAVLLSSLGDSVFRRSSICCVHHPSS